MNSNNRRPDTISVPSHLCVDSTRQVRVKPHVNAVPGYQQDAHGFKAASADDCRRNSQYDRRVGIAGSKRVDRKKAKIAAEVTSIGVDLLLFDDRKGRIDVSCRLL